MARSMLKLPLARWSQESGWRGGDLSENAAVGSLCSQRRWSLDHTNLCCSDSPALPDDSASLSYRSDCSGTNFAPQRWHEVIATALAAGGIEAASTTVSLKDVLSTAIDAVRQDEDWNLSGVPELLARAREMAEHGCVSAWRTAVSLLDFQKVVQRYRSMVAAPQLGTPCRAPSCSADKRSFQEADSVRGFLSEDMDVCGVVPGSAVLSFKRRRLVDGDDTCSGNSSSSSDGSEFAVPDLPAAKRHLPICGRFSCRNSSPCQSTLSSQQIVPATPAVWSGVLRHKHEGCVLELADVDVQLPPNFDTPMPAELYVSHLAPRAGVKIGSHHACRTSCPRALPSQLAKLRALAQHELVAVAPLGSSSTAASLLLVPYLNNTEELRCVSFLLVRPPALVAAPARPSLGRSRLRR